MVAKDYVFKFQETCLISKYVFIHIYYEIIDEIIVSDKTPIDNSVSPDDSAKDNGPAISNNSAHHQTNIPIPEIKIRDKPQGKSIISSPHNTDAVYTRKRDHKVVEHKAFVTETCDPGNPVPGLPPRFQCRGFPVGGAGLRRGSRPRPESARSPER